MSIRVVVLRRDLLESVLEYARETHPNEMLVLIRADVKGDVATVRDLVFPPFEVQGSFFVYFNPTALPPYLDVLGSIHSHPTGSLKPSVNDLIHGYGPVIIIVAYPYDVGSVAAYNKKGERIRLVVTD